VSNALFWISLASGAIVLAMITLFRFAHRDPAMTSARVDELSEGGDRPAGDNVALSP
jgi:hypothetical protein